MPELSQSLIETLVFWAIIGNLSLIVVLFLTIVLAAIGAVRQIAHRDDGYSEYHGVKGGYLQPLSKDGEDNK